MAGGNGGAAGAGGLADNLFSLTLDSSDRSVVLRHLIFMPVVACGGCAPGGSGVGGGSVPRVTLCIHLSLLPERSISFIAEKGPNGS